MSVEREKEDDSGDSTPRLAQGTHPDDALPARTAWGRVKQLAGSLGPILVALVPGAPLETGHQCGGCPMCMPPPIVRTEKEEKNDEEGEGEEK